MEGKVEMKEKKKYMEGTLQILRKSEKEKVKYKTKVNGKEFIVYPNVFSPKYFLDTEFFAKEIPVKDGEAFLEIGPGTGVVSIFAALKGAKRVVAIDVNPSAVANSRENVELHDLSDRITILEGDVFEPLTDEKFDIIFWNTPFAFTNLKNPTFLEKSVLDPEYKSTKKFIEEAEKYLKPDGRLVIGFSSTLGHVGKLKELLKENGYKVKLLKQVDSEEVHPVKFEIFEARLK